MMPRTAPPADAAQVYAVIPIAVFTRIDAGTASSSAFQRKPKIAHDHAGIRVHFRLESAFTMRWTPRSPSTGICTRGEPPKYSTINARIETVETAASYRGPWARGQRCLQVANGFYEWHFDGAGRKSPYYIHLADQEVFVFAALWDRSKEADGTTVESVVHITMPANDLMRHVHNAGSNPHRMPAILRKEDREVWLKGSVDEARGCAEA